MQKKTKKVIGWIILSLIILFLLLLVLSPFIENTIGNKIGKQLNGFIEYDELTVSLFDRSVYFTKINWVRMEKSDTIQVGSAEKLNFYNFDLVDYIFDKKTVNLRELELHEIHLKIYDSQKDTIDEPPMKLYDLIKDDLDELRIELFTVENANIQWYDKSNNLKSSINEMDISINNVQLDSHSAKTNDGWFAMEKLEIEASNSMMVMKKELHKVVTGKIKISTEAQNLTMDSLKIVPLYPKYELSKIYGYQTNWMDVSIDRIELSGFQLEELIYHQKLNCSHAIVDQLDYRAFRDKALEYHPDRQTKLPQISFMELDLPVTIDTVSITDAYFQYEEHMPPAKENGLVYFSDADLYISNLSNINKKEIKMHAKANLFGKSKLTVDFAFPMDNESGLHYVKGNLSSMDLKELNLAFEPLAFFSIQSGNLNELTFDFKADNQSSEGELNFYYNNLNIKLIEKEELDKTGLLKRIGSVLANTFVINKNNHVEKNSKAEIHFERDTKKSILNYWWKSIFSGMKSTVMKMELNASEEKSS